MEVIAQPIDFLGVNYYTRAVYRADGAAGPVEMPPTAPVTDMGWEVFPQGLTDLLVSLNQRYRLPPVYVAENGAAVSDAVANGEVHDHERVAYLQQHLDAVADAIHRGVDISGFFYWSLMDNFEWAEGYSKRFGLVYVDFETQQRIIKLSGRCYRNFLLERGDQIDRDAAGAADGGGGAEVD
jgi:beta-glucosidase